VNHVFFDRVYCILSWDMMEIGNLVIQTYVIKLLFLFPEKSGRNK
jgi:hypothetical protein